MNDCAEKDPEPLTPLQAAVRAIPAETTQPFVRALLEVVADSFSHRKDDDPSFFAGAMRWGANLIDPPARGFIGFIKPVPGADPTVGEIADSIADGEFGFLNRLAHQVLLILGNSVISGLDVLTAADSLREAADILNAAPMLALPQGSSCFTVRALHELARERIALDARWGGPKYDDSRSPDEWLGLILELFCLRPTKPIERDADYRRKLVEIMALACAALESHDRIGGERGRRDD